MRIAISGASGTGKTTLASALAEHYKIPINPIGSRTVAKVMGFDNPYEVDRDGFRVDFQERLFQMKSDWEKEHEHFVTDRSYLDNLAYCVLHMSEETTEAIVDRHLEAMERYEVVLVLPVKGGLHRLDDGVRVENPMYHALYDLVLEQLFSMKRRVTLGGGVRSFALQSDTISGRFSEATRIIDGLGVSLP